MKLNVLNKYIRRLRKVLKSKLNGGNLVNGFDTWTVSLLRYAGAFVSQRKSEKLGRKTRIEKLGSCLLHMIEKLG